MVTNVIVTDASVVSALAAVGNVLSVKDYDTLALYVDYTKGDEGGLKFLVKGMRTLTGDEHPLGVYSNAAGVLTQQASQEVQYSATGKKIPLVYDVKGVNYVKIYQQSFDDVVVAAHSATFDVDDGAGGGTITAGSGTPYSVLSAGQTLVISGTGDNDSSVVVDSVTDTVITADDVIIGTDGVEAATVITLAPSGTFTLSFAKTKK